MKLQSQVWTCGAGQLAAGRSEAFAFEHARFGSWRWGRGVGWVRHSADVLCKGDSRFPARLCRSILEGCLLSFDKRLQPGKHYFTCVCYLLYGRCQGIPEAFESEGRWSPQLLHFCCLTIVWLAYTNAPLLVGWCETEPIPHYCGIPRSRGQYHRTCQISQDLSWSVVFKAMTEVTHGHGQHIGHANVAVKDSFGNLVRKEWLRPTDSCLQWSFGLGKLDRQERTRHRGVQSIPIHTPRRGTFRASYRKLVTWDVTAELHYSDLFWRGVARNFWLWERRRGIKNCHGTVGYYEILWILIA